MSKQRMDFIDIENIDKGSINFIIPLIVGETITIDNEPYIVLIIGIKTFEEIEEGDFMCCVQEIVVQETK